jgi:hypothetical protein
MGNRDHHDAIIIYPVEKRLWKPVYQASANLKPKYWPAIRVSPYVLQCNTNLVQEVVTKSMSLPERDSKPAFIVDQAMAFLDEHPDQKWILTVNCLEPHHPLMGPCGDVFGPDDIEPRHFGKAQGPTHHTIPSYRAISGVNFRYP